MPTLRSLMDNWLQAPIANTLALIFIAMALQRGFSGDRDGSEHACIVALLLADTNKRK